MGDKKKLTGWRKAAAAGLLVTGAAGGVAVADGARRLVNSQPETPQQRQHGAEELAAGLLAMAPMAAGVGMKLGEHMTDKGIRRSRDEMLGKLREITGYDKWKFDEENGRYTTTGMAGPSEQYWSEHVTKALLGVMSDAGSPTDIKKDALENVSIGQFYIDSAKLDRAIGKTDGKGQAL
jgi:hypothetical protein